MTDRERLELAAKAAGLETDKRLGAFHDGSGRYWLQVKKGNEWHHWNPLTDDGDALRLAVQLRLRVWHSKWPSGEPYASAQRVWCPNDSMYYDDGVRHGDDPQAATRRAIVRAAAEIGGAA